MKDELPFDTENHPFPDIPPGGKGFAEVMSDFIKLTEIETRISVAIDISKVPRIETRKFLKGLSVEEILNTPLSQFIQDLFGEIGLGNLELTNLDRFQYTYGIKNCPVCDMFKDVMNKKVCNPTVDALYRFFSQDLQVENEVVESKCINAGDNVCEFKIDLQPLQVFKIALDETDIRIVTEIKDKGIADFRRFIEDLENRLGLMKAEIEFRIQTLQQYQIIDNNFKITPVGNTFHEFIKSNPQAEEVAFDPPWKAMSKLKSTIAATRSFAEAFVVVAEEEELPWMVDDKEIIDLKERSKDKDSFAKLLVSEFKIKKERKSED